MQFCAAAALATGRVDMASLRGRSGARRRHPRADGPRAHGRRPDAARQALEQHAWSRVTVRLRDGRTLASPPRGASGHPDQPLTDAQLRDKFLGCAAPVLGADEAEALADQIAHLEEVPDVRALTSRLVGPTGVTPWVCSTASRSWSWPASPPAEMPGMIMADMGADVLKIETPEPDRDQRRARDPADDPRLRQPQQALDDAEHEVARGPGGLPQARRRRRRHRRGLPARRDGPARRRLRGDARAESADHLLLALRLRPGRAVPELSGPRHELPVAGRRART